MKNTRVSILVSAFALLLLSTTVASTLSPNDLRPKVYSPTPPISDSQRETILKSLINNATKYLEALNNTSYQDLAHLQSSPQIIGSLMTEIEDTRVLMADFVRVAVSLKADMRSCKGWLILLRNYYLVAPYMEDLDSRGVVKSEAYIGLRLWLPFVFDQIVIPNADNC